MSLSRSLRGILVLVALVGLLAMWPGSQVQASELEESSLGLIPADAAFYVGSYRNGEQIKIIAESNAWKKLMNMPSVQMGLGMLEDKLETEDNEQVAQAKAVLENPQVKDLLGLLADMFSDDVFCYGSADLGEVLELAQDVSNAQSYGPFAYMASGAGDAMSHQEMQGKAVLAALAAGADKIKIPTMVAGFLVEDEERATVHMGKLEGFLGLLTLMQPQFAGRVIRQEIGDSQFLTVTLDGELIPWEEVPLDDMREFEENEGDVDKVVEKVKELNLVVAMGIREGYLMLAMTDSMENLEKLGQGDSLLTRPEMDVVKKHADKRLTGVSYASEEFVTRMSMSPEDLDGLLAIGDAALEQLPLDDDAKERIREDVTELADDLKSLIPKPGAGVGVSFLTDTGTESYGYNWTENYWLDGSKPLEVLNHIGGDPLLAIAWREHVYPDVYDRTIHWVRVGHEYFEEFGVPELSKKDRRQYKKAMKHIEPLFEELVEAGESWIEACDGQAALVIDAKMMSKQIAADVPATEEPMPMPEPAIVIGIKDADDMREAYVGFQSFFNGLLEMAREFDENGEIPEGYEIPWPDVSETSDTSTLSYTFPSEWGVDEQILPNAVLTDDIAVVTASEAHSDRLLETTAPALGGALADGARPRAVAGVFNWAGTVDALTPWIRLAACEAAKENLGDEVDEAQIDGILNQVDTVLEVLKAIRLCTVECYFEDGALVTHSVMEVQDVD